jgi:hypothetical protein
MKSAGILALAAALLAGCGGGPARTAAERDILLVSGRDDHGLVVQKTVGLSDWVGGEPSTHVPDGTLVRVESTHGEWIQVQAIERISARGWVNDYYLRGTAHVTQAVGPLTRNAQVELLEVKNERVRVRSTQTSDVAWVERRFVAELPAR